MASRYFHSEYSRIWLTKPLLITFLNTHSRYLEIVCTNIRSSNMIIFLLKLENNWKVLLKWSINVISYHTKCFQTGFMSWYFLSPCCIVIFSGLPHTVRSKHLSKVYQNSSSCCVWTGYTFHIVHSFHGYKTWFKPMCREPTLLDMVCKIKKKAVLYLS